MLDVLLLLVCLQGLNAGLQLLQRAFQADPTHPGVLCALSHFCLLKGQGQQVRCSLHVRLLNSLPPALLCCGAGLPTARDWIVPGL